MEGLLVAMVAAPLGEALCRKTSTLEGDIQGTDSGGPVGVYVHEAWKSAHVLENILVLFMSSDATEWTSQTDVSHNCGRVQTDENRTVDFLNKRKRKLLRRENYSSVIEYDVPAGEYLQKACGMQPALEQLR